MKCRLPNVPLAAFLVVALCLQVCKGVAAPPLALLPGGSRIVCDDAAKLVYEADIAADDAWSACATDEAFRAHQREVRARLVAALGGFPARTPLNARITGRVARDGYAIEKVLFESRPHFHVTAHLFLPDSAKFPGKRPGVIIPCGHSLNGKASRAYQRGAVKAVQAGLVALVYDPIDQGERQQSRGDPTLFNCKAHNMVGRRAELLGWSTATFRIWDGIRALDCLESRPEVDASRLGVMGHSGGGTMTSWIMCLDDRVRAAAPSGYLSTLRAVCRECGPQDAEQFAFGELAFGFNHLGHILLRAPSPVLHCASHGDFFPFPGVLDTAARARTAYVKMGAAEAYGLSDAIGPHAWHESTSTYAVDWMSRWLQGGKTKGMGAYRDLQYGFSFGSVDTALAYEPKNLADMQTNRWEASVTPTGRTLDLAGERTCYDILKDEAARQRGLRGELTPEKVRALAGIRAFGEVGFAVRMRSTRGDAKCAVLVADDGTPVVVRMIGSGEPLLYVTDTKELSEAAKEARELAATGACVAWADLRGFGETAKGAHPFYSIGDGDEEIARLYALVGINLVAKRAEDVFVVAKYIGSQKPVKIVAKGRAAVAAAHAAYAAGKGVFSTLQLKNAPCSWAELLADDALPYHFAETVFGAWKLYDWVDLAEKAK